ncbi:hypothetical protein ACIBQ1_60960 [Nonomuraea sp. NPDC050153]|uniref:hypothetical protein n=1 Tax=Nonomuraea sp. NPDC050153 TaxID=3364359 RepID=UPI00379764CC
MRLPPDAPARQRKLAALFNRIGGLVQAMGTRLSIPLPAASAVWDVESSGQPHVPGRTLLRFENHLLWRTWGQTHPAAFGAHFQYGGRPPRYTAPSRTLPVSPSGRLTAASFGPHRPSCEHARAPR